MDSDAIERAAQLLSNARLRRARFKSLPEDCRPRSEAEAYAVQDALHTRLSEAGAGEVVGHKIGCTTEVMQRYLGIDNPCAGGVLAATVHHDRTGLRHDAFFRPGVECEIAVRLADDLPAAGAPYTRDSVADAVGTCMAAIEIVDDRYEDFRALDAPTLIADDFFNAGCVLGPPLEDWRALDLATLSGRMLINGREVGTSKGADILGHPLEALAWLANAMIARDRQLAAGAFVLLGSIVQTAWVDVDDRIEVAIDRLGGAGLQLN